MQPSEEIKQKLDIVDLIRDYIQLTQAGMNWRAKCPFHREKSPSFMVSPEKQIWHCFGCFPRGSLIRMENELRPIEKIKKGESVISSKGRKRRVLLTMNRDYRGEIVSVMTRKHNEFITMTADHEVYAIKTKNCTQPSRRTRLCQRRCKQRCPTKFFLDYKIEKIPAKDLTKSDYLICPINEKVQDIKYLDFKKYLNRELTNYGSKIRKIPMKIKVDSNLLKLLGYYIAEGSNHRAYIRFSLGGHEPDFAKEIQILIKKIFGIESGIHTRAEGKSGIEVSACNSNLANIFANLCGKGAANKHIPYALNYLLPAKQRIILEAVFKGDGYTSKTQEKSRGGEKQIGTISRVLAYQLKDVLLRLNQQPGITQASANRDKKGVNHKESFTVRWREDLKGNYSDFLVNNKIKYWLMPIRKIVHKKYRGKVYNLTIKEDHSYVASHFAVGNCGKGGDVFSFVQEIESIDFVEALRLLASKAGVTLRRQDPKLASQRNRLLDILDLSRRYFSKVLEESPKAIAAREYLAGRGLSPEACGEWQVGYSPDSWDAVLKLLKSKGYKENEIFLAGMCIKGQNRPGFYDRFRGRIMFPINDVNGNTVAFTARVSPEKEESEKMGKYINSPQTQIYDKSGILFGLDKAKLNIKREDKVILVEGQMDAITAHLNGFKNVVASSGTALTSEQVKIVKRYTNNLYISFDMDDAGILAAERGIREAMAAGMSIKLIELPVGKDPDECIRKDPEAFRGAIETAKPVMDYYFGKVLGGMDISNIDNKREAAKILLPIIARLGDRIEQDYWLKRLSEKLDVTESLLREALTGISTKSKRNLSNRREDSSVAARPEIRRYTRREKLSELLLAIIIKFPDLAEYSLQRLEVTEINGNENQSLYKNLILYYNYITNQNSEIKPDKVKFSYSNFRNWLISGKNGENSQNIDISAKKNSNQSLNIDRLVLLGDKEYAEKELGDVKTDLIKIIIALKKYYLIGRMKEIEQMIAETEKAGDGKAAGELMEELKLLAEESRSLGE